MDNERRRVIALTAITLSNEFLRCNVFFDTSSDESDSDVDERDLTIRRRIQLRGVQRKPPRVEGYVEITVPRFTTQQFRRHFRMTPTTYETLEAKLNPLLSVSEGKRMPVRKQLLGSLWLLATPDSYRSVFDKHLLLYNNI